MDATRASKDGRVVGVRAGGPAARAGLRDGDVLTSMHGHDGASDVPVKLTVDRDGAKIDVAYVPRGARGHGQAWTRVAALADDKCGAVL